MPLLFYHGSFVANSRANKPGFSDFSRTGSCSDSLGAKNSALASAIFCDSRCSCPHFFSA